MSTEITMRIGNGKPLTFTIKESFNEFVTEVNKPVVYNRERINEKEDPQAKDPSIKCKHCNGSYCRRTMKRHLESKMHRFFNM